MNDDLDDYLARRKRKGGWKLFNNSASASRPIPSSVPSSRPTLEQREPGFWKNLFGAKSHEEEEMIPEDLTPDEKARLEKMERKIEKIDAAEKEHPEAVPQLEREKESLISKFFGMFRSYEHEHQLERKMGHLEVYEAEQAQKDEEVKKVLRIVHKWLEQLPVDEKNAFRRSPEFQEYKALLERYGLIKAKQPEESKGPIRNSPAK